MAIARITRIPGAITLLITIFSLSLPAYAKYSGGTGEPNDPYQIATAVDLMLLGDNPDDYDKHFILTADIDLNPNLPGRKVFEMAVIAPEVGWYEGVPFTGVFNGNGRTISHLTVEGVGLFGQLGPSAKVSNLGLESVDVNGNWGVGGLAGINYGDVSFCYSTGMVKGDYSVGGLVGENESGNITRSHSNCSVSGKESVGGLVGINYGEVNFCYSTGMVKGEFSVGGLVGENLMGENYSQVSIAQCYSTGAVSGFSEIGGLLGYNGFDSTVFQCYSTGTISGDYDVGGLVGDNEGWDSILQSMWDVETSGQLNSAGGVGLTTSEMKNPNPFMDAGWDFVDKSDGPYGVWAEPAGGGYPILWWQISVSSPSPTYSGGKGEPEDPYQIATAMDLIILGDNTKNYDKHFILTANIDLDPNLPGRKVFDKAVIAPDTDDAEYWFQGIPFTGVFDGNGHTILNLTITGVDYLGLFGQLDSGSEVKNLGIVDVNITGSGSSVGGLAGHNGGDVIQCYSTGSVDGDYEVGGLVGYNRWGETEGLQEGRIICCYSTVIVNGDTYVGGLVGSNGGNVTNCYSTSSVSGDSCVGGLAGDNGLHGAIAQCYSNGMVSGNDYVGGLVGNNAFGTVLYSVWDVETSGRLGSAGGVGLITAEMLDPYMLGMNGFANDPNWVLDVGNDYLRLAWEGSTGETIPEPDIDWLKGRGIQESPYEIDTSDQLIMLGKASILCDRNFILSANINLDPNLTNVGIFKQALIPTFSGFFNGNGHTISNLTIEGYDKLGFFGSLLSGTEIKNLGVVDVNITGSGDNCGGLVGSNHGTVFQCYSTGTINGDDEVGGLVGFNYGDTINCWSESTVSGNDTGGLVGVNRGHIVASYSNSSVSGIGSLGSYFYLGASVGGLVGINNGNGSINSCYSTGTATGSKSYSNDEVMIFRGQVGGLVGYNGGSITKSYSTGIVAGDEDDAVGGLVGFGDGNILNSIWDVETSGQLVSDGGVGLSTVEMMDPYILGLNGFSNDPYWVLNPGFDYPRLAWEETPGSIIPESVIDWLEGQGTSENPYQLDTADQLILLAKAPILWDKHIVMDADINMNPNLPGREIFSQAVIQVFSGVFEGNNHTISDLSIEGGRYLGLFGQLDSSAEVRDLGLVDVKITGESYVGGLVGHNLGDLINCYSTGLVSGHLDVGGLVGYNAHSWDWDEDEGWPEGYIICCYSTSTVSGDLGVGGLVSNNRGRILASYSTGTVIGDWEVGGLVGSNQDDVLSCYSTGMVNGNREVGGLVGFNNGLITMSYSTGTVNGEESIGGLVGDKYNGSVNASFWDIETSGQIDSAGGTGLSTDEMQSAGDLTPNYVPILIREYPIRKVGF